MDEELAARRRQMVERQIERRGIRDDRVLQAMRDVPRHSFVLGSDLDSAYDDHPLAIGLGQTISQPYMVALMTERLRVEPGNTVLEIGTGSGYQAAILAALAASVVTVERLAELAERARALLAGLKIDNVQVRVGDGTLGWPDSAPYDRIIVTAAAPRVPEALVEQLAEGGRLVIPVGSRSIQDLQVVEKTKGQTRLTNEGGCRFVPLIGEQGW